MADWDSALSGSAERKPAAGVSMDWDAALSEPTKRDPLLRPLNSEVTEGGIRPAKPGKYDPKVFTADYLWNEIKKVPGGLVGIAPDVVDYLTKKFAGKPTDFGNITRQFQTATGADVNMRPPGPGSEKLGIIAQNVVGSAPFAAAAIPARGAMGVATELLSGLGGGAGQIVGRESGNPWIELAANVGGSMAGFRVGNIAEKSAPIIKMGFEALASKEARAASALKARGLIEGSPEYQAALGVQMNAAKGEILSDLSKAYAQEDMRVVSKALADYESITKKFPGFKASVGEITGNEPALAMQAKLESRNIPALEERGARIRANDQAVVDARGALVPAVPGSGRAALRGVQSTLDDELKALGNREISLGADLAGASTKMEGAAAPLASAGADIKAMSQEGYLSSRGTANQKYSDFRKAVGDDPAEDAQSVISKLSDLETKFAFDKRPEVLDLIRGVAIKNQSADPASKVKAESLLQAISRRGGISSKEMQDLTGEKMARVRPGLFRKEGQPLDELATRLREEDGFPIPQDSADGGVQALRDLIQDELRGTKSYSFRDMDRLAEAGKRLNMDDGTPKLNVAQLDDLASVASRDIQDELARTNPNRRIVAQLQAIRTDAKESIEYILAGRANMDALKKYQEANRYFGQEHAPKYLEGVNLKVRMKDALNEQRVKPEAVVAAYFKPNGTTEARRFNTQFADNGAAKETLARGVFDLYKKQVIDAAGGSISPVAHDFFMRKYASTLAEYPWIAKRLEKNAVGAEIAKRMQEVRAQRGEIAASDVAKSIGERDPEAFIQKAVSDKRFMFDSLSKMKPADRQNMAVAVLNKAWDQSSEGSKAVNEFLKNEDNVKMLFRMGFGAKEGAEHLNNIKMMARALEINESAPKTSPMTALAEDSLKAKTGTSFLQVMSALRAMGRRPGSGDWFAMVFGGQYMKAKIDAQKTEVLREQLFDPQLLQATLQQAKSGQGALGGMGDQMSSRARQIRSKLWDLTKAAVGEGATTAAAKRLPVAAVSAEEQ